MNSLKIDFFDCRHIDLFATKRTLGNVLHALGAVDVTTLDDRVDLVGLANHAHQFVAKQFALHLADFLVHHDGLRLQFIAQFVHLVLHNDKMLFEIPNAVLFGVVVVFFSWYCYFL